MTLGLEDGCFLEAVVNHHNGPFTVFWQSTEKKKWFLLVATSQMDQNVTILPHTHQI